MKFKYTSKFESGLANCKLQDVKKDMHLSKASLDNLQDLIPSSVDLDSNVDLIGVSFPFAVINQFNKNDDAIMTDTALAIKDSFAHKPMNVEHYRWEIIGHIVNCAFSEHETHEIVKSVEGRTDVFNMSLGAVVYKVADNYYVDLIKDIQDGVIASESISTSWEVGFNDFYIGLGGKNLDDCEIITDKDKIEEMKYLLKAFNGPGETEEGVRVRRIITGKALGLGGGFTMSPAASVLGVYTKKDEDEEEQAAASEKTIEKTMKNSSQTPYEPVDRSTMDKKDVEKLIQEALASKSGSDSEVVAKSISKIFVEKIAEESNRLSQENEQAEAEAAEKAQKAEKELEELKSAVEALQGKLSEAEAEKAAVEAQATFNDRMGEIDEIYHLEDDEKKFVANRVSSLDVDVDSFAKFKEELAVILKHKNRENIKEQEEAKAKEIEEKVEKLSQADLKTSEKTEKEEEVVEEVVLDEAKANADTETIPNSSESGQNEKTTLEKLSDLGASIKVG